MKTCRVCNQARPLEAYRGTRNACRECEDAASRASIGQKKWADEVRAKIDEIARVARNAGKALDAETLRTIKEGLYGG